jgi:hypothetical protein
MYRRRVLNVAPGFFSPRFPVWGRGAALFLALCWMQSCGIETYHYLPPVPSGNIASSQNQWVSIDLPGISSSDFTHFALYYRIYISYSNRTGFSLSQNDLRDINQTLASDYAYLNSYTSTSTATTVNIASVMSNRGYYPLYLQVGGGVYSSTHLTGGGNISLNFGSSAAVPDPHLVDTSGSVRYLIRSNGGGSFTPVPADRRFVNRADLNASGNINQNTNADVAGPSGSGSIRHAYAAIYIATAGINEQAGYTPLFSIPAFVGIFLLPDR